LPTRASPKCGKSRSRHYVEHAGRGNRKKTGRSRSTASVGEKKEVGAFLGQHGGNREKEEKITCQPSTGKCRGDQSAHTPIGPLCFAESQEKEGEESPRTWVQGKRVKKARRARWVTSRAREDLLDLLEVRNREREERENFLRIGKEKEKGALTSSRGADGGEKKKKELAPRGGENRSTSRSRKGIKKRKLLCLRGDDREREKAFPNPADEKEREDPLSLHARK